MKKTISTILFAIALISCQKIEETITKTAKEKTENLVKETIGSSVNIAPLDFQGVFSDNDSIQISKFKGKKINLPNGKSAYIFKYRVDKDLLFPFLEKQKTTNENRSDKSVKKINGKSIIKKMGFIENFIPENIINTNFINDIKNDENIEFYKLKRFPNSSTIIYNPKNKQVFQLVEIES